MQTSCVDPYSRENGKKTEDGNVYARPLDSGQVKVMESFTPPATTDVKDTSQKNFRGSFLSGRCTGLRPDNPWHGLGTTLISE
jgi:hypothetical protein